MKRTAWLALALVVAGLPAGCVTRRVMITSDPPGAVVFRNGQPLGATPIEESFIYYGRYHYRFVADGYQPLDVYADLIPPWYQWPGIDFISENVLPFGFHDVQQVHGKLIELQPVRPDDVKAAADALQRRGQAIQPPANSPPSRRQRNAQTLPTPAPANGPMGPGVQPGTLPLPSAQPPSNNPPPVSVFPPAGPPSRPGP